MLRKTDLVQHFCFSPPSVTYSFQGHFSNDQRTCLRRTRWTSRALVLSASLRTGLNSQDKIVTSEKRNKSTAVTVLPLNVVQRIASGEVISDYASVVLELVENALDASAQNIDVDVDMDRRTVTVCDDGKGIASAEDLARVACCNATSKLRTVTQLEEGLYTLGFRGQALWALAAVCGSLTISTRCCKAQHGLRLSVGADGKPLTPPTPVAMATGTAVVAAYLPWEVSSTSRVAAFRRCKEALVRVALCHPHVTLRITRAGRPVWVARQYRSDKPNTTDDAEAVAKTLAREAGIPLAAVPHRGITLDNLDTHLIVAIASPAAISGTSLATLVTAVNGRAVRLPLVARAIAAAARVRRGRYPIAFLRIQTHPAHVDWNVCPKKSRMRFRDSTFEARIASAVSMVLSDLLSVPFALRSPLIRPSTPRESPADLASVAGLLAAMHQRADLRKEPQTADKAGGDSEMPQNLLDARVVAQVLNTYILVEHSGGIVLIEQHVADERALYESLLENWYREAFIVLKNPITLKEHAAEDVTFRLSSLGFDAEVLEDIADDVSCAEAPSVLIRSAPRELVDIPRKELTPILKSIAADETSIDAAAASIACRLAVRNGRSLKDHEMKRIVRRLFACKNGHTCPHGRPIFHQMDVKQLAKLFGRSWAPERPPARQVLTRSELEGHKRRSFIYGDVDK